MMKTLLVALLLLAAPAAAQPEPGIITRGDNYTLTTSGLLYEVLHKGEGATISAGQTAVVHYTGWLIDGTKFDSSVDRKEPLRFPLGQGRVIPGWDEGVDGMAVGERRKLMIPAGLGYGKRGVPGTIPPNSMLIFEVELLGIE